MSHPETSIQKIVSPLLAKLQGTHRPSREGIDQVWERVAGSQAARHSRPTQLSKRKLIVSVDSSGWLYALGQRKEELLEGMVEFLGAHQVKSLNFRIGEPRSA